MNAAPQTPLAAAPVFSLQNLTCGYDGTPVLENISLDIPAGRTLCILGPNGCGKTTLLKAMTGLLPSTGDILLSGERLSRLRRRDIAKKVALLGQLSTTHFAYSVYDTVMLGRYVHLKGGPLSSPSAADREFALHCLETVGLCDLRDRLITTLSGGQLQRVYLARALAQDPQTILLDEPTNHLDLRHQAELMAHLRTWAARPGRTVIGVMHDINLALRLCDDVVLMHEGAILAHGLPGDVLKAERLTHVYGMDVVTFMLESLETWKNLGAERMPADS